MNKGLRNITETQEDRVNVGLKVFFLRLTTAHCVVKRFTFLGSTAQVIALNIHPEYVSTELYKLF
jgi:uncharacterized membrane protein